MPSGIFRIKAGSLERDEFEERAAKISAEHKRKDAKPVEPSVGPVESMREKILRLSLFPNIYNSRMIHTES